MTDPKPLTGKQHEILDFIRKYIALAHYAPTYSEIEQMLGMKTKSHVHYHLCKLRAAGLITWTPGRARTIRLVAVSPHPERSAAQSHPERSRVAAQSKDAELTAALDD